MSAGSWKTPLRRLVRIVRDESRKSPIVFLGGMLIVLILGFMLIGNFLRGVAAAKNTEAAVVEKEIAYRVSLLNRKDGVAAEDKRIGRAWTALRTKIYTTESSDLAFSQMRQVLNGLFKTNQAEITSFRFDEIRTAGAVSILPVTLEFAAPYAAVVSILYLIESHDKYMKIGRLDIASLNDREDLRVTLVVEGFWYHEKASPENSK